MVIEEYDGLTNNEIYKAAMVYLGNRISPNTRRLRLRVTKPEKENTISLAMERNEEVTETFNGAKFKWIWICKQTQRPNTYYNRYDMSASIRSGQHYFELSFHKKHKELALNSYLPFILKEAKGKKQEIKTIKIFTVDSSNMYTGRSDSWKSVNLDHPSTFETLAMDVELKEMVMRDLERFVRRREKYRKVGKAWKRGYLLYGPPGTWKSSLIAAMANYLNFDIYDLEMADLRRNSELRKLMITTANRSILVVEDIDCTIELQDMVSGAQALKSIDDMGFRRQELSKVTLSGFLNFIDGLWSSCEDERIIIFTTNYKEKLHPALLRPGRMDLHIHMSYCTPDGFKLLAANYLDLKDHKLFLEIENLIRTIEVTPAEIAEQLLKSDEADEVLADLVCFLHVKMGKNKEAKAKQEEAAKLVSNVGKVQKGDETNGEKLGN